MYKVAALYVPPFYTTLGWYDWVNDILSRAFKHALEMCVNFCKVITKVLSLFSLIPWTLNKMPYFYDMFSNQSASRNCIWSSGPWNAGMLSRYGGAYTWTNRALVRNIWPYKTLGCSICAVQGLLDHHQGNGDIGYLPSSCRHRCTTVTVRQVWQLVRHCIGHRTWTRCSWLGH